MQDTQLDNQTISSLRTTSLQILKKQYYTFLHLFAATNSFTAPLSSYSNLRFQLYQVLAVIGSVQQVILSQPLVQILIKSAVTPTALTVLLPLTCYVSHVIPFNISIDDNRVLALTNLTPIFHNGMLCFAFRPPALVFLLPSYPDIFQPMEQSLAFHFSEIHLRGHLNCPVESDGTVTAKSIKQAFKNYREVSAMGSIRTIRLLESKKSRMELAVELVQDVYPPVIRSMGVAKIILHCNVSEQERIMQRIQRNRIYLLLKLQPYFSDGFTFCLHLYQQQVNVVEISDTPLSKCPQQMQQIVQPYTFLRLFQPMVLRNLLVFDVSVLYLKLVYGKAVCGVCGQRVNRKGFCARCKAVLPKLSLWVLAGVWDESGVGEISLEDEVAMEFFDIEEDAADLRDVVLAEEGALFYGGLGSRVKVENQIIRKVVLKMRYRGVRRKIIGVPRNNFNEVIRGFDQETKVQLQSSLMNLKTFMRSVRVYANGYVSTENHNEKAVKPYIKVIRVVGGKNTGVLSE